MLKGIAPRLSALFARPRDVSAVEAQMRRDWDDRARENALLYEQLATLRLDVPLAESIDDLHWRGPKLPELEALCQQVGAPDVVARLRDDGTSGSTPA